MNAPKFMIGCDPEVFLNDHNNKLVAASSDLYLGTKDQPHMMGVGKYCQVDGTALEFNIDPIVLTTDNPTVGTISFSSRVSDAISSLNRYARNYGQTLSRSECVSFQKDYFDSLPEHTKELGCDPDFNAWQDGEMNPTPDGTTTERGAAGHVHLGWIEGVPADNPEHIEHCCRIVKIMDFWVGLYSVGFVEKKSRSIMRRKHYGKAGAFRPKHYGVEYRSPSNGWIWTKRHRHNMYKLMCYAVDDAMEDEPYALTIDPEQLQSIINTCDKPAAASLLKEGLELKGWSIQ